LALVLLSLDSAPAQTVEAKIKISGFDALVEGKYLDAGERPNAANFSFLKSYANVENLAARVSEVKLFDVNGQRVDYKKLDEGEFLAGGAFQSWNYKTNLSAPPNPSAMAHVSWLSNELGILMLGDLLPEFPEKTSGKIEFELPASWQIASVEKRAVGNAFDVADLEKAVFYVGRNWRAREIAAGSAKLNLIVSGDWQVSDDEAAASAREIFAFYETAFGGKSFARPLVFLGKFPPDVKPGRWEAETRGFSATIFSSEMNFKTQSLQRLHEQLRHEIFHFWLPNGVNLAGNYDWFYEGFALYASLKLAVATNRIRFEDFLDTLARAHSVDTLQSRRASLIDASKNRWNGANTQVYARGMLVAFLVDIALLHKSKGKTSLRDALRESYQKHGPAAPRADGNAAILSVLRSRAELRPVVEKYVEGAQDIAWQTDLAAIGIESATENFMTKLKVKTGLSGRQKDLLDELGYNNWRKNSESSK
jgi:predicted metalloprotease with PDZ domain